MDETPEGALTWSKVIGDIISSVKKKVDKKTMRRNEVEESPNWVKSFWHVDTQNDAHIWDINDEDHTGMDSRGQIGRRHAEDDELVFRSALYKVGLGNQVLLEKLLTYFVDDVTILRLFVHLLISPPHKEVNLKSHRMSSTNKPQAYLSLLSESKNHMMPDNLSNSARCNMPSGLSHGTPISDSNTASGRKTTPIFPLPGVGGRTRGSSCSRTTLISGKSTPRSLRGDIVSESESVDNGHSSNQPLQPPKRLYQDSDTYPTLRKKEPKSMINSSPILLTKINNHGIPPPPPKRVNVLNSEVKSFEHSIKMGTSGPAQRSTKSFEHHNLDGETVRTPRSSRSPSPRPSRKNNVRMAILATNLKDSKRSGLVSGRRKGGHRQITSWAQGDLASNLGFINSSSIGSWNLVMGKLGIDEQLAVFHWLIDSRSGLLGGLLDALRRQKLRGSSGRQAESLALRALWLLMKTKRRLAMMSDGKSLGVQFASYVSSLTASVSIDKVLFFHTQLLAMLTTPIEKMNTDAGGRQFIQRDKRVHNPSIWLSIFANLNCAHLYPRLQGLKDVLYLLLGSNENSDTLLNLNRWPLFILPLLFDTPQNSVSQRPKKAENHKQMSSLVIKCQAYILTIATTLHWRALVSKDQVGFASAIRSTLLATLSPCLPSSNFLAQRLIVALITTAQCKAVAFWEMTEEEALPNRWKNVHHLVKLAQALTLQTPGYKLYVPDHCGKMFVFRKELQGFDDQSLVNAKRFCLHTQQAQHENLQNSKDSSVEGPDFILDQRALEQALQRRKDHILPNEKLGTHKRVRSRSHNSGQPQCRRSLALVSPLSGSAKVGGREMEVRSVGSAWVKSLPMEIAIMKKSMLFLQHLRLSAMMHMGNEKSELLVALKPSVEAVLAEIPVLGESTAFLSLLQSRYDLLREDDVWKILQTYSKTKDAKHRRRVFRPYEKVVGTEKYTTLRDLDYSQPPTPSSRGQPSIQPVDVLLVGPKGSGRSTVRKQMMRVSAEFTGKDPFLNRLRYARPIRRGMIAAMRRVCTRCSKYERRQIEMEQDELMRHIIKMLESKPGRLKDAEALKKHLEASAQHDQMVQEYRNLLRQAAQDFSKLREAQMLAKRLDETKEQNSDKAGIPGYLPAEKIRQWTDEFFEQFKLDEEAQEARLKLEVAWRKYIDFNSRGHSSSDEGKHSGSALPVEAAQSVKTLWNKRNIQLTYRLSGDGMAAIGESAPYFFGQAIAIATADASSKLGYVPSDDDVVHCPEPATEKTEYFKLRYSFVHPPKLVANPQKNTRKRIMVHEIKEEDQVELKVYDIQSKVTQDNATSPGSCTVDRSLEWLRFLDKVSVIVYVVDLSSFDQPANNNQLLKGLTELDRLCLDPALGDVPIVVCLNKADIFRSKLEKSQIQCCFPEIDVKSASSFEGCLAYVCQKFERKATGVEGSAKLILTFPMSATKLEDVQALMKIIGESADISRESSLSSLRAED
ncbi:hypothetical protein AAMO2058_000654200 [Amorphochlora amoebiformis]